MTSNKSEQLAALIDMTSLISSTLEIKGITQRAISATIELLSAEAGSLLLIDQDNWELFFEEALGEKGEALKAARLPQGCGIAGWVAQHGIPQLVKDVRNDARFYRAMDDSFGFQSREIACVPVRFKDQMFGVLEAINKTEGSFSDVDLDILQTLGNQVAVALENARLYQENCRQYEEMLAVGEKHQEEREKLLKDLHDGIGGLTTNINLLSELGQKAESMAEMKSILGTIAELSREGMGEIRTFMNILENKEADWPDLAAEFRRYGHSMIEPHAIEFTIETRLSPPPLPPGIFLYLSLFRIYKESLANIIKHAKASRVAVNFSVSPTNVAITIQDNGTGFSTSSRTGRGIANMHSRIKELDGKLYISGELGTLISLEVPLPQTAAPMVP
jgi:signal transduction histidine kinase